VVDVRAQVVHADGVDAHDLHKSSITHADLRVTEGILTRSLGVVASAATGLVGDADDLDPLASVGLDKVSAPNLEGLDGSHRGGGEGHEGSVEKHREG
jgi:hypothetical protein